MVYIKGEILDQKIKWTNRLQIHSSLSLSWINKFTPSLDRKKSELLGDTLHEYVYITLGSEYITIFVHQPLITVVYP